MRKILTTIFVLCAGHEWDPPPVEIVTLTVVKSTRWLMLRRASLKTDWIYAFSDSAHTFQTQKKNVTDVFPIKILIGKILWF